MKRGLERVYPAFVAGQMKVHPILVLPARA
jgi:hypothetical protein